MIRTALLVIALLAGLFALAPSPFAANGTPGEHRQEPSLADLLERLGKKTSRFQTLKTDFVQVKSLAIFRNKVTIRGRIYLQKPGRIAWHVDEPVRYSVYMDGTVIRQWDEDTGTVQEISLAANPVFKNVLNQLTLWFSGDYRPLLDGNDVRVVQQAPLVLEFLPKESNFASKIIRSIRVTYRQDETYLQQISIHEIGGDSTTITFTDTVVNGPVSPGDFEVKRRA